MLIFVCYKCLNFEGANTTAADVKATLKSDNEVFMPLILWSGRGLRFLSAFLLNYFLLCLCHSESFPTV